MLLYITMKQTSKTLCLATILLYSSFSFAIPASFKKHYPSHWFLGLGGSVWGGIDTGKTKPQQVDGLSPDFNQASVLKVFGGYLFHLSPRFFWGPELSIISPSKNKNEYSAGGSSYLSYSSNSVGLLLDTKYYLKPRWYVELDVGMAYVQQTVKTGQLVTANQGSYHKSAVKPEIELATGFQVDQNIAFALSYEYRAGKKPDPFVNLNKFVITDKDKQVAPFSALMIAVTLDF